MINSLNDLQFLHDPYPAYAALREVCPVQEVAVGNGHRGYLITGYHEARQAFTDPRLSNDTARFYARKPSDLSLHPDVSRNLLALDPPHHTRLRRLVPKAFTPGAVTCLRPYIQQLTDQLLSTWAPGRRVDVVADLAAPLPVTVICQLLGVPEADRPAVGSWSNDLFAAGQTERTDHASHALAHYMADLIASKRGAPDESLLHDLITAGDDYDQFTDNELVSLSVLLLVAGHETTTNAIGNALLTLLQHPADLQRLRANPDLIRPALDELLRIDPSVGIAAHRWTTETLTLGTTEIPAGTPVFISPGAANRDPRRYPEPDRLDLDRAPSGHLAFGHGIHRCLAAPLGLAELEIALHTLITRFPQIRLAVPTEELHWRRTRFVRGLSSLPVLL
ncbi:MULTISPECIES: cytochrome P450 [unclassified Streptomyces]|uniref:cytochrome P450 family protein n=1 Tax=unclassified Streptomyces TaxID=2593676 RepID=UPI0034473FAB